MSITPEYVLSPKAKDLTGQRFGRLVACKPVGRGPDRIVQWEFQCDCGNTHVAGGAWVTSQRKKATNPEAPSCGCLQRETIGDLRRTHGMSKHPLFWVWVAMVERCHTPGSISYHKYGAKGVYVCDQWKDDSAAFMQWALANGWQPGLHLDKDILCHQLDVPPHYSPQTCQFIGASENSRATKKWLTKHH